MNYTIYRSSVEKDREELLKFWNENHEKDLNGKYQWIYEGNPAGKATVFLVRDNQKGECVGCLAVFPRQISIKGTNLRAAVVGDLLVHKVHRILGPALKLEKSLISSVQEKEFDLVYGFPNKKSELVMKLAGFECLGSYIRMFRLINTSEPLQKLHFPKFITRVFSPMLNIALKLCVLETWYRSNGRFTCEEIGRFDERFDQLWRKSQSRFEVVGERTSKYLTWKFLENPNAKHKIFAICTPDKTEVRGYIIYCDAEDHIDVRDFILPEGRKAARVFVTCFLRHIKKASPAWVAIRILENKKISKFFRRFGFVRMKRGYNIYYSCNEHVLKTFPLLEDSKNWFLLEGDTDR